MVDRQQGLATSIMVQACKVAFPDLSGRVEGLAGLSDLLLGQRSSRRARKSLANQLEEATEYLCEHLSAWESVEFRDLPEAERDLAIEGIVGVIEADGLSIPSAVADMLTRERIIRRLSPKCESVWTEFRLSQDARVYGRAFLEEACQYAIALIKALPEFGSEVLWQNYVLTRQVSEKLEQGIDSVVLPRFRLGTPRELARFESIYLTSLMLAHSESEVFGLDVPARLRRQQIDVAYVTLQATRPSTRSPLSGSHPIHSSTEGLQGRVLRVDESLGKALSSGVVQGRGGRVLVLGAAGSGKTTVSQWLVTQTARGILPRSLDVLKNSIPFIVQFRNLFKHESRRTPTIRDLLGFAAVRDEVPGGWIERILEEGRALVIFDGLDEISGKLRSEAQAWVDQMSSRFPKANYVITSRPDDLEPGDFYRRGFVSLEIQPMELADVRTCISSWYRALRRNYSGPAVEEHRRNERALLRDVEYRRPVRDLATTPLLCAMLCAFYAYNIHESELRSRADLYERVITTLVDARERGRGSQILLTFTQREKFHLLQAIAAHMSESGQATIRTRVGRDLGGDLDSGRAEVRDQARFEGVSALRIVESALLEIPTSSVMASEALNYLLERSVVFREVVPGTAQFAHRTFQEYLAARSYAGDNNVSRLLEKAGSSGWDSIISLTAGISAKGVVSPLIEGMLDIAHASEPPARRHLLLLVAECLGAATSVDPAVGNRARQAITEVLPPRNSTEADLVAGFGDDIVPFLQYDEQVEGSFEACVRTAARIGGTRALDLIERYSLQAPARGACVELVNGWEHFDVEQYANRVLSKIPLTGVVLDIRSMPALKAACLLPNIDSIRLRFTEGLHDFHPLEEAKSLRELDTADLDTIQRSAGLSALKELRKLNLSGNDQLREISEICRLTNLRELYLAGCRSLVDGSPLATLDGLKVLVLDNCPRLKYVDWLDGLTSLQTLSFSQISASDLRFCAKLNDLRFLRAQPLEGISVLRGLDHCSSLRRIDIRLSGRRSEFLELDATDLREVRLTGVPKVGDLATLAHATNLRRIELSGSSAVGGLVDLSAFSNHFRLVELAIDNAADLETLDGIGNLLEMRRLSIKGAVKLRSLSSLSALPLLEAVSFDGCIQLEDVGALAAMPALRNVSLLEGVPADIGFFGEIERSGRAISVEYEDYRWGDFGDQG